MILTYDRNEKKLVTQISVMFSCKALTCDDVKAHCSGAQTLKPYALILFISWVGRKQTQQHAARQELVPKTALSR